MKNSKKLAALLGALLIAGTQCLADRASAVEIIPPNAKYHGKTYSEWHAAFWQWSLALPVEGHPFLDTPEFDFSAGQSGGVWFVGAPDGPIIVGSLILYK